MQILVLIFLKISLILIKRHKTALTNISLANVMVTVESQIK